jgi:hypothetical protein
MPLAFPNVGIQNMSMRLRSVVSVSESPFTLDTQPILIRAHDGKQRYLLPPLVMRRLDQC